MKKKFASSRILRKNIFQALTIFYFVLLGLSSFIFYGSNTSTNTVNEYNLTAKNPMTDNYFPDSIYIDSTQYSIGDTIDFYVMGADTAFIIYDGEPVDSSLLELKGDDFNSNISMFVSGQLFAVQDGLLGLNITDLFEPGHANETIDLPKYTTGESPWDYLSDLSPTTLRVFSGQGSRFMELLGSERTALNDPFNPTGTIMNGGYGFCMERIIPFYDKTQGLLNEAPPLFDDSPYYPPISIWDDMNDLDKSLDPATNTWLDADYFKTFEDFYHKWENQPLYDPTNPDYDSYEEQPLYLNQLINLINKIESENPDHSVSVILCLNILSEPASKCKDIIEYLQDEDIDVEGVEIGNEVYFGWAKDMLGIRDFGNVTAFIHYWDYINGSNYTFGTTGVDCCDGKDGDGDGTYSASDFNLSSVLPADMLLDHDYISVLKSDPNTVNVKIGLPGHNLPNCGEFVFITDNEDDNNNNIIPDPCPECNYADWNTELASKYTKQITGTSTYKFNSVILHPYYTPTNVPSGAIEDCNTNWLGIPQCLIGGVYDSPWDYGTYDERLECAFDALLGYKVIDTDADGAPDATADGNFREFITEDLKTAMNAHSGFLKLNKTDLGPEMKEIWYTEYNINTDDNISAGEEPYISSVLNTFAHGVGLWNWMLWNIKSNAGVDYRPNYFTIATLQSYLSGTSIALMSPMSQDEEAIAGLEEINAVLPCDGSVIDCATNKDCLHKDIYQKRLTYYSNQLINTIIKENLTYVKTASLVPAFSTLYNVIPTVFYNNDLVDPKLYVFFTNVKDIEQTFKLNPLSFKSIFPGATGVQLTAADIKYLNATVPYATSGSSTLYAHILNEWYNCAEPGAGANMHGVEIDESDIIEEPANSDCIAGSGSACVVVPPYSLGYFTINVDVLYRLGELIDAFSIYPNPSNNKFYIQQINNENADLSNIEIEIYNSHGSLVQKSVIQEGEGVDISMLPVGVYNVNIKTSNYQMESEVLIKMK